MKPTAAAVVHVDFLDMAMALACPCQIPV